MSTASSPSPAEALAACCRAVYERRLTPAKTGNISLRHGSSIWITPTGCCLGEVEPAHLVETTMAGGILSGQHKPSSEWLIHREIYRRRADIGAVIHAHPSKATALAAAHCTLDTGLIAEVVYTLGEIPLIPYVLPGSEALAGHVGDACSKGAVVMLLANHGVVATGKDLREALFHLELLESVAEVYFWACLCPGGPKLLGDAERRELLALKEQHQSTALH